MKCRCRILPQWRRQVFSLEGGVHLQLPLILFFWSTVAVSQLSSFSAIRIFQRLQSLKPFGYRDGQQNFHQGGGTRRNRQQAPPEATRVGTCRGAEGTEGVGAWSGEGAIAQQTLNT